MKSQGERAMGRAVAKARHGDGYDISPKLIKETAAMGVAHRTDSIANYDAPHLMTHLNAGLKAKNLPLAKEHIKHAKGHAQNIIKMSSSMKSRVTALPGVKKEMSDLDRVKSLANKSKK